MPAFLCNAATNNMYGQCKAVLLVPEAPKKARPHFRLYVMTQFLPRWKVIFRKEVLRR